MGKNTDKLYITHSEWSGNRGGRQQLKVTEAPGQLPLQYCSLSLQPFTDPVAIIDSQDVAFIFDVLAIVPWIRKHGTNPHTGQVATMNDLLNLHFHRNIEGQYCDPVTAKIFNDHTHVVALRPSGNVFAFETIDELNLKGKNLNDLISGEAFSRADVITLQNPHRFKTRQEQGSCAVSHIAESSDSSPVVKPSKLATADRIAAAAQVMANLHAPLQSGATQAKAVKVARTLPYNAAPYSDGKAAASFTSTAMDVVTQQEPAILSDIECLLKPKKIRIKGYAQIQTGLGNLSLELFTEFAPKAVYNFIKLAKSGYFDNVSFHRNISGFMIQGGDPTGKGNGGRSFFGSEFSDEFSGPYKHNARGVVSMANKGKDTNTSQFFIIYGPQLHLTRKHTIFGQVVGGFEALDAMELMGSSSNSRVMKTITMQHVEVFLDPFEQYIKEQHSLGPSTSALSVVVQGSETDLQYGAQYGKNIKISHGSSTLDVGKYLALAKREREMDSPVTLPRKKIRNEFSDFSNF